MEDLLESYFPRFQHLWADLNIDTETLKTGSIAAFVSILALYVGYLYIVSLAEAPLTFNVPLPEQLRADWNGPKWEDLKGEDKKILEDQVQGVSCIPLSTGLMRRSDIQVC